MRLLARRSLSVLGCLAVTGMGVWGFGGPAVAADPPAAVDLPFTGNTQSYQVPTDGSVCVLGIDAAGANGGDAAFLNGPVVVTGGTGGTASAFFQVTPGETISVDVGGRGSDGGQTANGAAGGFGGGGTGGNGTPGGGVAEGGAAGGGGSTTVREGSTVILVAGGGGGAGTLTQPGGIGGAGGNGGGNGSGDAGSGITGGGGLGGTPVAGGGGGPAAGGDATAGTAGIAGQGGTGGNGSSTGINGGGGGGGGGVFGGGGGGGATNNGSGGGAGGGAGFVSPDALLLSGLAIGQDGAGNGTARITPAGSCAQLSVEKVVDGEADAGTIFTVHVECSSVSEDLFFDALGNPTTIPTVNALPGDTCRVTETDSGGAVDTQYLCTDDQPDNTTCQATGNDVVFAQSVTFQSATVTVANSFVVLQPRFTG